jgi:hypothetical protein
MRMLHIEIIKDEITKLTGWLYTYGKRKLYSLVCSYIA